MAFAVAAEHQDGGQHDAERRVPDRRGQPIAAIGYQLDPADVARLTPLGHPTINLDGRYRTTSRPPTAGLRPLRAG